jgi:hypothetical protein
MDVLGEVNGVIPLTLGLGQGRPPDHHEGLARWSRITGLARSGSLGTLLLLLPMPLLPLLLLLFLNLLLLLLLFLNLLLLLLLCF